MDQAKLHFIAAGAFFVAAIINFLTNNISLGAACTALGTAFIAVGSSHRRSLQSAPTPLELSGAQQREVQSLIDGDREVEAVKRVREETGARLLEAKRYVDQLKSSRLP